MSFGNVYTTTVNVNGKTVFRSRYSPCCGPMFMPYPMMSCFGYGFGGYGLGGFGCFWPGSFGAGLGAGVGFATGAALAPALPSIVKGIGSGCAWLGSKVIAPAAKGAWNGIKWVGKSIGKGVSNLFHKKNKTEKTSKSE